MLRQSVRQRLAARHCGVRDAPGSWISDWDALDAQGLWSTIEPPDGSLAAAAVVVEELGRGLYAGPACESLAANYVRSRVEPAQLPAVGAGTPAVGLVTDDSPFVRMAPETLVIVATAAGGAFAGQSADLAVEPVSSLDVTRDIVALSGGAPCATAIDAEPVRYGRLARTLLYCADTLGCVDYVLHRAAEYARQRTTFGSPIGKYQAVAHRLVDHAVTAEQMRLLLDNAVAAFDERTTDLRRCVATAETFFFGRASDLISDCIQLAGAIGFTWEFGYHFYLRRVVQNATLGGGVGRPQQRLAKESAW